MKQQKILTIAEYELPIKIHEDISGGYTAVCSLWSDCYAQGDTLDETINEISSVAASLVELYKEEGLKVPLKLTKTSKKPADSLSFNFRLVVSV